MKISRFYQDDDFSVGDALALSAENHRHAIQVLRLSVGESLILFNGRGGEYHAKLTQAEKRKSQVLIESFDSVSRESELSTSLLLATIKPDKMDFAIQKAVELGVTHIQPIYTKRSVIKIKQNRLEKKMQHWQGVIIAACEQSGRTAIPEIKAPQNIEQYLQNADMQPHIAMFPGSHPTLNELESIDSSKGVALLIGPEGGFTDDEEQQIMAASIQPISFGSRILRAETAVVAGLTAFQQRWGDL